MFVTQSTVALASKGTFYGIKQFLTNLVSDGNKSKPCIGWGLCILFVFTGRHNISSVI